MTKGTTVDGERREQVSKLERNEDFIEQKNAFFPIFLSTAINLESEKMLMQLNKFGYVLLKYQIPISVLLV